MAATRAPIVTPWMRLPSGGCVENHVFAIGDVHGYSDLLAQALAVVKAAAPIDGLARRLIFLGDLIDRGPDSIGCLQQAVSCDAWIETTILPGNHEQMMLAYLLRNADPHPYDWLRNGGASVVAEVRARRGLGPDDDLFPRDIAQDIGYDIIDRLLAAPGHVTDGDLTFVHGGINPRVPRAQALGRALMDFRDIWTHWAWMRDDFIDWTRGWRDGREVVVHGHTVEATSRFSSVDDVLADVDRTRRNRRINLDAGVYQFGQLAILEAADTHFRIHVVQNEADFSTDF